MNITQKRILLFCVVLATICSVAFLIIKLAQGYRPDFSSRSILPNGLMVATSVPDGAQVFIDGKLKSATNSTFSLSPDEYLVEIKKDGFFPWKKKLTVKKELVTKTEAYLFAAYPDLKVLTFTGATNPNISPDGQKVAYGVTGSSVNYRGVWVLDLADRPLGLNREPRQILQSAPKGRDFGLGTFEWSPDSKQLLVTLSIGKTKKENFLVDTGRLNPANSLIDISLSLSVIRKGWENEEKIKFEAKLSRFPELLLEILSDSTKEIQFSLDETKVMYTATASAKIPEKLIPLPPVASTQPESRQIEKGKIYVYDFKEDKNFYLMEAPVVSSSQSRTWFPTSKHIFIVQNSKISISEYDGTNKTDVYTGPLTDAYAFPFPAGNRILILAALGKETPPNLYAVTLR